MKKEHVIVQRGFTLLELLIAISVFAVMSVMAYGGLSNVIANSESSEKSLARLQEIQQTFFNIERDFSQIIERGIRDEFGVDQPYISAGNNIDLLIEFTRSGRRNPARLLRSHLVRVAYRLNEGTLIRMHWPQLDRAPGMEASENPLLNNVKNVELRFLDDKKEWHTQWPPLSSGTTTPTILRAIEYKILLDDWGEISRLYQVRS